MTRACQPVPAEYNLLLMTCAMTLQWACQPCSWTNSSELASPGRLIWAISNSNVLALARIHKHSPYRLLRSGTKAKTRGESSANFVNATDEQVASMWISGNFVCKLGLCVYKWHSMQHIFISLVGWKYSCTVRKASRTRRFESEGAPQWVHARNAGHKSTMCTPQPHFNRFNDVRDASNGLGATRVRPDRGPFFL
jgi:hypothetical protein